MHAISPYLLRSFNRSMEGPVNKRYVVLDKVGAYDTLQLLGSYVQAKSSRFELIEDSKQVFRFSNVNLDAAKRELTAWLEVGHYGIKTDIINIETGQVDFEKAQNNAEILKHYIHFFIPRGVNEGIALFHSFRGAGIKTVFHELFKQYFTEYTNLAFQMNPLSYDKALAVWQDADAKELRVTKFTGLPDIADQIRNLGHGEQELVLKPPRKGTLGKLKDYFIANTEQANAVEILSGIGSKIKTVVELGGKRRTFQVGVSASNSVCDIELDEAVELRDGIPDFESLRRWCRAVVREYCESLYPDMEVA